MFNDEGLGAAMAQAAVEKKADELAARLARIENRQVVMLQVLSEILPPDALRYLTTEWNRT